MTTAPTTPPTIEVSLVVTLLNEAGSIDELLAGLAAGTAWPREIIAVDGGSTDDTLDRLRDWQARLPLRIVKAPGSSISAGRNIGIAAARCAVIAVTDAGTRPAPAWLETITARLRGDDAYGPPPDVVSGWFVADPRTPFEAAMGATVLPALYEIDPAGFLPSSRSIAFRKAAWRAVAGYPEWLDYGEDLVFDLRLRQTGHTFAFVPAALVRFRPRPTLPAFWRQYFRYARGDGKAGLWRRRHLIRYAAYAGPLALLALGRRGRRRGLLLATPALLAGGGAYLWQPFMRLLPRLRGLGWRDGARAVALIPLIRLTGDLAKMAGYPVGLLWRARRYGLHRGWREIEADRLRHESR